MLAPVSSMTSRSIPRPRPPIGGAPYSSARKKVLVELHRLGVAAGGQQRLLGQPSRCSTGSTSSE